MDTDLEYAYRFLPNLRESQHKVTSSKSNEYNCLAWAVGDSKYRWWPNEFGKWLRDLPEDERPTTFIQFFDRLGFAECADWNYEAGVTKVAMFARGQITTHFAVQYSNGGGIWSSKLGEVGHDISHNDLFAVEGGDYGSLEAVLRCDGDIRNSKMKRKLRRGLIRMKATKIIWG